MTCGQVCFPRQDICPYCSEEPVDQIELSRRVPLWAWTAVTAPPPGYEGPVPYGFGVVELPEGVRVITRLTEPDPAKLERGQAMELVLDRAEPTGRAAECSPTRSHPRLHDVATLEECRRSPRVSGCPVKQVLIGCGDPPVRTGSKA